MSSSEVVHLERDIFLETELRSFFFQYCHLYSLCESTLPTCKVFLQKRTKTFRHLASKRFLRYFTPNFPYGKSIYLSVFFKICCIPGN